MVLEAKFSNQGADTPGKRQLLCVVRVFILIISEGSKDVFKTMVVFKQEELCARPITFNHIVFFFFFSFLQANTHVNVHQELKDVKLWQVLIFYCLLYSTIYLFQLFR